MKNYLHLFYKIEYSEDYSSLVGEDVYFCTKANEAGYEVYVSLS